MKKTLTIAALTAASISANAQTTTAFFDIDSGTIGSATTAELLAGFSTSIATPFGALPLTITATTDNPSPSGVIPTSGSISNAHGDTGTFYQYTFDFTNDAANTVTGIEYTSNNILVEGNRNEQVINTLVGGTWTSVIGADATNPNLDFSLGGSTITFDALNGVTAGSTPVAPSDFGAQGFGSAISSFTSNYVNDVQTSNTVQTFQVRVQIETNASVPEPSSVLLSALAGLGLLARRKRA